MRSNEYHDLCSVIFRIESRISFRKVALRVFEHQFTNNSVYRSFCELNGRTPDRVSEVDEIPFLPVELFKNHEIVCSNAIGAEALTFISSGTTGSVPSRHKILDPDLYVKSFLKGFEHFYGDVKQYNIFALLPSYLERAGSSLVYMVEKLHRDSGSEVGGFYLDHLDKLERDLKNVKAAPRKTMLIGVSFALLDFASVISEKFPNLIVVETGGMKGRRQEMIRAELHSSLKDGFGAENINSEYGMTELCSQAWSISDGRFYTPPWMKTLIRDIYDPFHYVENGKTGAINIVDLANLNSCSFIATSDLGRVNNDGSFEVLGRSDGSEMRGCNLMVF